MSTITDAAGALLALPEQPQQADWPDEEELNQTAVWQPPIDMIFNDGHRLSIAVYRYRLEWTHACINVIVVALKARISG